MIDITQAIMEMNCAHCVLACLCRIHRPVPFLAHIVFVKNWLYNATLTKSL